MVNLISYQAWLPALMLMLTAASLGLNLFLTKRSNDIFKREQMEKKADKVYVDSEIAKVEKQTDLKIQLIEQSSEENRALLEHIVERVDKIFDKHFK